MRPAGLREPVQLEVISSHPKSTEMGRGKAGEDAFSGKNVARKCKLGEENVSFALGTLNGNFIIANMLLPTPPTPTPRRNVAPLPEFGEPLARAALVGSMLRPQS